MGHPHVTCQFLKGKKKKKRGRPIGPNVALFNAPVTLSIKKNHACLNSCRMLQALKCRHVDFRDWSLITGRGGYKMGKSRVKLFAPPLLKSGNFSHPPLQYGFKLLRKNYPKTLCAPPPPSAWLKLFPPPLFVEVKLHPLPFCSPPAPPHN